MFVCELVITGGSNFYLHLISLGCCGKSDATIKAQISIIALNDMNRIIILLSKKFCRFKSSIV